MKTLIQLTLIFTLCCAAACKRGELSQEPLQSEIFTVNGEGFEMVLVEGGTFMMGATSEQGRDYESNEKPAHEETLSSFYIGKYEVTQQMWEAVMGADFNPSFNSACKECPVEQVSWKDAETFITKLNILTGKTFRLPTEMEWGYAARGGNRSRGYKYSGSNRIDEVAWYLDNYQKEPYGTKKTTHPVGMKKPNELGLYDMSGNVWEWCSDWYKKEYHHNGKSVHPEWPLKGAPLYFRRIIRGGSWGGSAKGCRVSYIDYDVEGYRDEYGGLRLVLEPDTVQLTTNK